MILRMLVIVALVMASACGGTSPIGPSKVPVVDVPPPVAPVPTAVSVAIDGPTILKAQESRQYKAILLFSDGSEKDVTMEAKWSSSAPSMAAVSANGMVTAMKAGNLEIKAEFGEMPSTLKITVEALPAGPPTNPNGIWVGEVSDKTSVRIEIANGRVVLMRYSRCGETVVETKFVPATAPEVKNFHFGFVAEGGVTSIKGDIVSEVEATGTFYFYSCRERPTVSWAARRQ